jgi:hypothetical protein
MFSQVHFILFGFLCLTITLSGQEKHKTYYLHMANNAFTKAFGNTNWTTYYSADTTDVYFSFPPEHEDEQIDSLVGIAPSRITVYYDFIIPEDYQAKCSSSALSSTLYFDSSMILQNPEELIAIPRFIRNSKQYSIIPPRQAKQTALDYNLKKGLLPWEYCLNYTDSLNLIYWDVYSMLKEETPANDEYGESMHIDALTGKFMGRYDTEKKNLSQFSEKDKVKKD